ncbi:MAG: hypothetical protein ACRDU5_07095 [Mycobacterium sp.]
MNYSAPTVRVMYRVGAVGVTAAALVGGLLAGSATANAIIVFGNASVSTAGLKITVVFNDIFSITPLPGNQVFCALAVDRAVAFDNADYVPNGGSKTFSDVFSRGEHRVESTCRDATGTHQLDSRTVFLRGPLGPAPPVPDDPLEAIE